MGSLARLIEFSDREFLFLVDDLADPMGWVTTQEIAEKITGISSEGDKRLKEANRSVGSRLAWMRRFGVIERNPETRKWRINSTGAMFLARGLRGSLADELEGLDQVERVEVMRRMAAEFQIANRSTAIFMRREWTRGVMPR